MEKIKFLLLLLLLTTASVAWSQKRYHDAEVDQIKGNPKSVTTTSNGQVQTVTYTSDGRLQMEGLLNPVYNSSGYITECDWNMNGMKGHMVVTYNSKNQEAKQVTTVDGGTITQSYSYNKDGTVNTEVMTISSDDVSQSMTITYSYKAFDSHGNWTSRTSTVNGQSVIETRTIVYY